MPATPRPSRSTSTETSTATLGRHRYDCVLVLDVLEHLKRPEEGVRKIAEILKPGGTLYASTGNIAFLVMRLSLFLGQFNYGKRGILDLTHTRLFTIYSFKKLLTNGGFVIKEVHGFGPPIRDMIGASGALRAADTTSGLLARLWPRMFAFSFLIVAEKAEELEDIYARTLAPPACVRAARTNGSKRHHERELAEEILRILDAVRRDARVEQREHEERRIDDIAQAQRVDARDEDRRGRRR